MIFAPLKVAIHAAAKLPSNLSLISSILSSPQMFPINFFLDAPTRIGNFNNFNFLEFKIDQTFKNNENIGFIYFPIHYKGILNKNYSQ